MNRSRSWKRAVGIALAAVALPLLAPAAHAEKPLLTVYTYDAFASKWGPGPKVETAFEAQCGCDLKFVALDSSVGILSRLKLEGKQTKADVALGLDTSLLADARASGLFAEHGLQTTRVTLPGGWHDRLFVPFDYGYFAFVYDSTKLKTAPHSLAELAASGPKLKIIIEDPRSSTPGLGLLLWVKSVYGDHAAEFWRQLAPHIVTVTKGWSEAYGLFLDGEADMVLSYTTSPAYHVIAEHKTQYRAAAFSEGHYMQVEIAGKLKNAPHPALAKRFLAFILTPEFQSLIPTGNWMFPVMPVALPKEFGQLVQPVKSLIVPGPELAAHRKAWVAEFVTALGR